MTERLDRIEASLERLTGNVDRLTEKVDQLTGRYDNLVYEVQRVLNQSSDKWDRLDASVQSLFDMTTQLTRTTMSQGEWIRLSIGQMAGMQEQIAEMQRQVQGIWDYLLSHSDNGHSRG